MKTKSATTVAEPVPPPAEKPPPNVILRWAECYRRCQQVLSALGRTCFAVESDRSIPWEPVYTVFDAELRDGGRVTEIPDFVKFARELGVIDDCEKPFGPGWGIE